MLIRVSPGTRSAKNELKRICDEKKLDKFVNADFKKLSGKISNVGMFCTYANVKSHGAIKTFADALNLDNNMQRFLNAVEKQARSFGTITSGLFYKLIYNNIHQKTKGGWTENLESLKRFEKEVRKFLLAKKGQDIDEEEAPEGEGLDKLSN